MIHREDDGDAMPGQDSFIDVVCNMVGILIVLVMVVGARASRTKAPEAANPIEAEVASATPGGLTALEREIERTAAALQKQQLEAQEKCAAAISLRGQSEMLEQERAELAHVRALVAQELDNRRGLLDAAQQHQFDVQRRIDAAQIKLTSLTDERLALLKTPGRLEEVECVPTPIARAVDSTRVYVRIKYGELAVVPVEELNAEGTSKMDHLRSSLQSRGEANDTFGPIDGFRVRVVMKYADQATTTNQSLGRREPEIAAFYLPSSDRIGLPVEQAILPTSPLMRKIRALRTESPTVIAWVYPDSYSAFSTLKKALWDEGIPLSAMPRTKNQPIAQVSNGIRPSAQ